MNLLALVSTRHEYNSLFGVYVPIAAGVWVLVLVLVLLAVLRYRRRPPTAVSHRSENNPLEIGYAIFLTAVVAFLLYLTFGAEHRVDTVSARERPRLTVNVIAARWEWEFAYPRFGIVARSGVVGRAPLVVPAGEAVRLNLDSVDVIHSFWVPEIEFKRDLIPGAVEHVTLSFPRTGLFRGSCAEFCGLRHPEMLFNVRVVSAAAFAAWIRSGGRGPA